jgi:hypothetical protein
MKIATSLLILNFLKPLLLISALLTTGFLQAQSERILAFGPGINRYGVGADFKYYQPNPNTVPFVAGDFSLELGNIQHPREVALINPALQSSGIYKFGKVNYAWALRPYYMVRYALSVRQDRKSVALNAVAGAGLPVAYTWPVYIRLYQQGSGPNEQFDEVRYDPEKHPQHLIGGRAPFSRGFGEGNFTPGLGLNGALEFSWGNYRSDVKIVSLGMRVEGYAKKLPILYIDGMNKRLFSMFYLTFALGIGKN